MSKLKSTKKTQVLPCEILFGIIGTEHLVNKKDLRRFFEHQRLKGTESFNTIPISVLDTEMIFTAPKGFYNWLDNSGIDGYEFGYDFGVLRSNETGVIMDHVKAFYYMNGKVYVETQEEQFMLFDEWKTIWEKFD